MSNDLKLTLLLAECRSVARLYTVYDDNTGAKLGEVSLDIGDAVPRDADG